MPTIVGHPSFYVNIQRQVYVCNGEILNIDYKTGRSVWHMPRRRRKRKVVRVNSRRPINIDKLFFGAVAVYMCVICYMALTSVHIAGYGGAGGKHWQSTIPIKDLLFGRRRSVQQILPVM